MVSQGPVKHCTAHFAAPRSMSRHDSSEGVMQLVEVRRVPLVEECRAVRAHRLHIQAFAVFSRGSWETRQGDKRCHSGDD